MTETSWLARPLVVAPEFPDAVEVLVTQVGALHGARGERVARRFFTKVEFSLECWTWARAKNGQGYGNFSIAGSVRGAHRVAWYLLVGEWPSEHLDHLCKTPSCVNPAHLDDVSCGENSKRGVVYRVIGNGTRKYWGSQAKCRSGLHEMTEDNTKVSHRGGKACIACATARARRNNERRRAA